MKNYKDFTKLENNQQKVLKKMSEKEVDQGKIKHNRRKLTNTNFV